MHTQNSITKKDIIYLGKFIEMEFRDCRNNSKDFEDEIQKYMINNKDPYKIIIKYIKKQWGCRKAKKALSILKCPLNQVPLYVNYSHYLSKAIVLWRLSISK